MRKAVLFFSKGKKNKTRAMKVMKFGGAVLKSVDGFRAMVEIVRASAEEPLLIVVSAFSKSTSRLQEAAISAESGLESKSYKILDGVIDENASFYHFLIKENEHINKLNAFFKKSSEEIRSFLKGISITREVTPRTMDLILSYGELFALQIVSQYFSSQGFTFTMFNATDIIVTNDNYGNASPIIDKTFQNVKKFILPAIENNSILLTQGFVARSENGEITTMGMESSNLTAALLANMLDAKELTIWTDVEGFRSNDPKIVSNTELIPFIDFKTARFLSMSGMKLLYPSMLDFLEEKNIKLVYRSAFNPTGDSTVINSNINNNIDSISQPITMIITKPNLFRIKINDIIYNEICELLYAIAKTNSTYYLSMSRTGLNLLTTKKVILPTKFNPEYDKDISLISCLNLPSSANHFISENMNEIEKHYDRCFCGNILRIVVPDNNSEEIIRSLHYSMTNKNV
mgnify:CR=1 FL=1